MTRQLKIAILPGDGIGPEVMAEALRVLDVIETRFDCRFERTFANLGGIAIDREGKALPQTTIDICRASDAVLLGSVGGPQWEHLPPMEQPERGGLLPMRKLFNLYANLRPAIVFPSLTGASSLREEVLGSGLDILVVRELTGGLYMSLPKGIEGQAPNRVGVDTLRYSEMEIERIARVAFEAARNRRKQLVSVDKANVLASSVLWREIVAAIGARDYPDIALSHMYVDNASMQLIRNPRQFDVILCENLIGDILSDEASALTGSLGMVPSASLAEGSFGVYEPAGGTAPDIAGQGIANPIAQILSASLMLRYSLAMSDAADAVDAAVARALEGGFRTGDIFLGRPGEKKVTTAEMGTAIIGFLGQ
jgi:3-isopropylmalate dehydrogenase